MDSCGEIFLKVSKNRGVIPLDAVLEYFDTLELYLNRNVLNLEERDFLIEFIIDSSPNDRVINWNDFQQLIIKLLNKSLNQLVNNVDNGNSQIDDTMGVTKFNKLLNKTPSGKQISLIKERICRLESLILKSRSNSLRDSLIECYQMLNKHRNENIERIKRSVDKQDIIIGQLKKKTRLNKSNWLKMRYIFAFVIIFISMSFIIL